MHTGRSHLGYVVNSFVKFLKIARTKKLSKNLLIPILKQTYKGKQFDYHFLMVDLITTRTNSLRLISPWFPEPAVNYSCPNKIG